MDRFYISSKEGVSGICKYSNDFYELVLKEKRYTFLESSSVAVNPLEQLNPEDRVHIEIGLFQKNEIDILFTLLKNNFKNVSITVHDPPLVKYPFYEFGNSFINKISKFYDRYFPASASAKSKLKKVKAIYCLSQKGLRGLQQRYGLDNVTLLPHIINSKEIEVPEITGSDFVYFGFIGRNKGIEYALKLHQTVTKVNPGSRFYVVGTALGKEIKYYDYLKKTYNENVEYLGYVPTDKLAEVFSKATFAPLFFNDYKFYHPFSGSILFSLLKGKIVLTNSANTSTEIIRNGSNGFCLTGDLKKDTSTVLTLVNNKNLLKDIQSNIPEYLMNNFSAEKVKLSFEN